LFPFIPPSYDSLSAGFRVVTLCLLVSGLLASQGTAISSEVNVAMAIFVLPLNSALNPFLYTLNVVLEKRQARREERLKEALLRQLKQQHAKLLSTVHVTSGPTPTEETGKLDV
jgi:hypothetical protein